MANEDQHERLNDDPSVFIDKIKIHRDANTEKITKQSYSAQKKPKYIDECFDRQDPAIAERRAQDEERRAQDERLRAQAVTIMRDHKKEMEAKKLAAQKPPPTTGSSGTGCVISIMGFIVLVACFFALAELRLLLMPALRAGSLFLHIESLLLSGGK